MWVYVRTALPMRFQRVPTIYTLYTVDATKFITAQIDATFHEGRGKLTINSILQALMLGCLGRDFVGKQSKDTFSFCHISSLLKNLTM